MKDVSFLQHKINNAGSFLQTINVIIIAKQPVLVQLKGYRSHNKKSSALILQTGNIIIIAK